MLAVLVDSSLLDLPCFVAVVVKVGPRIWIGRSSNHSECEAVAWTEVMRGVVGESAMFEPRSLSSVVLHSGLKDAYSLHFVTV